MVDNTNKIVILDGSLGHLLKSKGVEKLCSPILKYDELFAATSVANEVAPDIVEQVHQEYIQVGRCHIITTNTFGCTQYSLSKAHLESKAIEYATFGASLARKSADSCKDRKVLVAGCIPPLRESYIPHSRSREDVELMQSEYKNIAAAIESYVDIFLCETVSSITEGLAAAAAVATISDKPWWISFTLEDNEKALLRSGERLYDAVNAVIDLPGLDAVLVNCCAPPAITAALPVFPEILCEEHHRSIKFGGYANGFKTTTSEWLDQGSSEPYIDLPEDDYDNVNGIIFPDVYAHKYVEKWIHMGATIVGGCCGTTPLHIKSIAEVLHCDRHGCCDSMPQHGV